MLFGMILSRTFLPYRPTIILFRLLPKNHRHRKLSISRNLSGYVGANGVTEDMHEGGYATPKGIYSISDAFYIYEAPVTELSSFQITNDSYWVDDPNSVYYNQHIEGLENKDWESAEHMIDYTTAYEYGCVIDYNTDAVYNAGSAIFFHVRVLRRAVSVLIKR